ncbi:MAG: hypothetical protein JNK55_19205 [Rubrivivax sp.]|nr:hypothetical protein [Rubrivivax sp.]
MSGGGVRLPAGAALGWVLALLALVVGYVGYGWQGLVLALTVIVFWLLLQFSRSLRVLRDAAGRPVGSVDNAVMLQAKLHAGMRLPQVLRLTRSLGTPLAPEPDETWAWADAAGDRVELVFVGGRLARWSLHRVTSGGPAVVAPPAAAPCGPGTAT